MAAIVLFTGCPTGTSEPKPVKAADVTVTEKDDDLIVVTWKKVEGADAGYTVYRQVTITKTVESSDPNEEKKVSPAEIKTFAFKKDQPGSQFGTDSVLEFEDGIKKQIADENQKAEDDYKEAKEAAAKTNGDGKVVTKTTYEYKDYAYGVLINEPGVNMSTASAIALVDWVKANAFKDGKDATLYPEDKSYSEKKYWPSLVLSPQPIKVELKKGDVTFTANDDIEDLVINITEGLQAPFSYTFELRAKTERTKTGGYTLADNEREGDANSIWVVLASSSDVTPGYKDGHYVSAETPADDKKAAAVIKGDILTDQEKDNRKVWWEFSTSNDVECQLWVSITLVKGSFYKENVSDYTVLDDKTVKPFVLPAVSFVDTTLLVDNNIFKGKKRTPQPDKTT